MQDLQGADIVLVPSRSEPAGHMGLKALCSGKCLVYNVERMLILTQ